MPFTISHAAAVLPFGRTRLPMAALMIGSMAPDFAYFMPNGPGVFSHSIPGLFAFCWPVALLVWLVYVHLLETPTLALLPDGWRRVFPPSDRSFRLQTFAWVSLAVVLGAATHIVWDWFTHAKTPVFDRFPHQMAAEVEFLGKLFPLYRFLQHVSTVVGLVALTAWVARIRRSRATNADSARGFAATHAERVFALLLMLTLSAVLGFAGYFEDPDLSFGRRLFHGAIGGMTGWSLAWVAIAIRLQFRLRVWRE